jgi:hypothetical protein
MDSLERKIQKQICKSVADSFSWYNAPDSDGTPTDVWVFAQPGVVAAYADNEYTITPPRGVELVQWYIEVPVTNIGYTATGVTSGVACTVDNSANGVNIIRKSGIYRFSDDEAAVSAANPGYDLDDVVDGARKLVHVYAGGIVTYVDDVQSDAPEGFLWTF